MTPNPLTVKNFLSVNYIRDVFNHALKNKNIDKRTLKCADNVHIIIPFYRKHLFKTLIKYYKSHNIILHPVCDEIDIEPFKDNKYDWVRPLLCPPLKLPGQPGGEQCYRKINDFIETRDIVDNDFYGFCGDDDMFEPGFSDEIKKSKADIVFISRYAGDKIPPDGAPHFLRPLIIKSIFDVYPGGIGLGQFFVRGYILRKLKWRVDTGYGDGLFAQTLLLQNRSIEFRPDVFMFINYFQPNRFTDASKFLKPTWELPKYEENTTT